MRSSMLSLIAILSASEALEAVIYTGFAAYCDNGITVNSACWDAAGWLLGNSSLHFNIRFLDHDQLYVTDLTGVDLYIQPGGGNTNTSFEDVYADMEALEPKIKSYVAGGGRYLGISQGGYLAGNFSSSSATTGFDMLPTNITVDEENIQDGTQATDDKDAIIQVDYTLMDGTQLTGQWLIFQNGPALVDWNYPTGCNLELQVVGQYSNDSNVALGIIPFGEGVLGIVGPHAEADSSFWQDTDYPGSLNNPDNPIDPTNNYLIGADFLHQLMAATPTSVRENAAAGCQTNDNEEKAFGKKFMIWGCLLSWIAVPVLLFLARDKRDVVILDEKGDIILV